MLKNAKYSIMRMVSYMQYPTGINKTFKNIQNHSNRGMNLEKDINLTNQYYLEINKANIHKKPTPITIDKVNYPSRYEAVITEAHFKTPSTTDYNGIYKGKYLDFEAKETANNNFFPLANIHKHQVKHLENILYHGGIGFLIIRFSKRNETYLLEAQKLITFINENTRKSIPIEYFQIEGYKLKENFNPRLDYLKIIDQLYF